METIEALNARLKEYFGYDDLDRAIYRIVWANDQLEKRRVDRSEMGVQFLFPEVIEVKKYPYLKDMYVLERLSIIPEENREDLPLSRISYEPVWSFCDKKGFPLYPIWDAAKFVVDTIHAAQGKRSLRHYVESEKENTDAGKEQRVKELQEELFGNETDMGDALRYHSGVVVPSSYNSNKEEN